jgi:glycosyltransferase involved in cell wall biosynthesis
MRVLLTVDAVGGVWQYGLDLARALAVRSTECVLVQLGPPLDARQRSEAQSIPGVTLIETALPLDWLCDGPAPIVAASASISEMARALRVDVIHLNMPTLGATMSAAVPVVTVAHGCVSTWWQAAKPGELLDPNYRWHRQLVGDGLRAADRTVAPTASFAEVVTHHYRLAHRPHVVHNGRTSLVTRRGALQDRVLTVGRLWDPVKGAALLDRVAARCTAPFDAAGATSGPRGERVDLRHLHLLGQLDGAELGRQLAARPVFVSAASFEPFGLAVLEAASAGCALILSDMGSFRELWEGAALFVPVRDEDAYVEAIEMLIRDPDRRQRLGEAASRRAVRYTPQAMADGMLAIYSDVLSRSASWGRATA